ncbi:MAG: hypothetical protein HGA48_03340 [Candidatus Yonathbacteria bacterium]|nr:hypothetical protein [Candidatus Yonathbacteria bacterium]
MPHLNRYKFNRTTVFEHIQTYPRRYLLFICGMVILCLSFFFRHNLYTLADSLLLIPQEETFTALYFEEMPQIQRVSPSQKNISFSFTVENHENTTTTYPYSITATSGDTLYGILTQGELTIEQGQKKTLVQEYTLIDRDSAERINITTHEGTPEERHIHFYLSEQ